MSLIPRFGEDPRSGANFTPCKCYDEASGLCVPDSLCRLCNPALGVENLPPICFRVGSQNLGFARTRSRAKYSEIASTRNATGLGDAVDFGLPMGSTGNSEFSNAQGAYSTAALGTPIGGFIRYPNGTAVGVSALKKLIVTNCFNKHGISIDPNTIEFTSKSLKGGIVTVAFRVGYHGIIFQVNSMIADITGMFSSIYYLDCSSDNMPFEILLYMGRPAQQRGAGRMPINYRGAVGQPLRQGGTVRNPSSPIPANTDRRVNAKKCERQCKKDGLNAVYINGDCYCVSSRNVAIWEDQTHHSAMGTTQIAMGRCDNLYCPEDRVKKNCRCKKIGSKSEGNMFSNFANNQLAPPTNEMSEGKCRRTCKRGGTGLGYAMYDGKCRCVQSPEVGQFLGLTNWHNATSSTQLSAAYSKCEAQVSCPEGWTLQTPRWFKRCKCIPPPAEIKDDLTKIR
jgi:hypothetical protein